MIYTVRLFDNKEAQGVYYAVIKHNRHLKTQRKCTVENTSHIYVPYTRYIGGSFSLNEQGMGS